jgi:Flp pilus assembly protein TadB
MDLEHEKRLTEVESRSKSNAHRLDEVEKRQDKFDEIAISIKLLAEREKRVEEDVGEIKEDVKTLAEKPGKKWDGLMNVIMTGIVGAIIGAIATALGAALYLVK